MAAGDPTGADLASVTYNVTGTGWGRINFDFDTPYNLETGKKYAIVVVTTGLDSGNYVKWVQFVGNGYANGLKCLSADAGSSWSQISTRDLNFVLWSGGVSKDSYGGTGATQAIYGDFHLAQTMITTSSYSVTRFSTSMSSSGNPVGTITASIRKVEGESYTSVPTKANTPAPTNANTSVTLDQATITWVDGGDADTFNVYYGTTSGNLTLVSSTQAGTSFTVTGVTNGSPYAYLSVRYWRIDSTNIAGTTTGDEWTFTTLRFKPPEVIYIYSGQYYRLLIDSDGNYGAHPPVGVENTDYVYLAAGYEANFVATNRRLVSAADNKIWIEDI